MTKTFKNALDALEIFSEIGLSLAPAEPDEYMCRLGAKTGNIDEQTARRVYRQMIDCALDRYFQLNENPDETDCSDFPGKG